MSNMQYEDLEAIKEIEETPEAHLLHVHIPDGFTRADIGAKVEYDFGRVRIFGERSLGYNKFSRFNEKYQVPSYCDINNIKGRYDGNTIIVTMPKIPGKSPKLEPQPAEQQAQESQPNKGDESATGDNAADKVKDQEGQEGTSDNQDPKSTVESKGEADHETPTPPEATKDSMPQKGQEESTSQKDQVKKDESKGEADHEKTSTPPEATQESVPQKGQQGISHEATVTRDAKLQTEENTEQKVGKEETKDHPKKTTEESRKPEKENKEESKGSATVESLSPKKINGEKKSDKKSITESTRTRIKEMAASTTQAITSLAKRFSEDDKQKLIYTGATMLVVALGVYASYKYRSSRRP